MASKTMKKIGIAHVSVKLLKEWLESSIKSTHYLNILIQSLCIDLSLMRFKFIHFLNEFIALFIQHFFSNCYVILLHGTIDIRSGANA